MRVLFVGDVVGRAGRKVVADELPGLRERYRLDFVVLNGENAAGGFGITETICQEFLDAGVDVVTSGNHIWDQREALVFIERQERLLRPLNFQGDAPGRGSGLFKAANGADVLVVNVMGRVFMGELDCPFQAIEREFAGSDLKSAADAVIIDFHAEATSEKQAFARYVDGRASCVIGTHTHVPTSDDQILPLGTAFISDAGMCGDYDSVLGMRTKEPLARFLTKVPSGRFETATGEGTLAAVAIDIDDKTGLANAMSPLRLGGKLRPIAPEFWSEP
jgi:hypothetical protein